MKLDELLKLAHKILEKLKAPHGIIGAFGMSAYGYQRATNDIDFLVDDEYRAQIEVEFVKNGFKIFNQNEEVMQLEGPGPIDIIFAKRPLSKNMLKRKNPEKILGVRVIEAEDIIGLKIQALATNPKRKFKDLGDIQALCQAKKDVNWETVKKYADLFDVWDLLEEIKRSLENE
jgi:predicted nucleotidyltransferase